MKIIAHRANIGGPISENENRKTSIKKCIELGYDVEIDIRLLDGKLFLGHDEPQEIITEQEIKMIKNKAWIHCKNLNAISFFNRLKGEFNYFWHEKDSYTLTSMGYIWAYPREELSPECICVMPELDNSINKINFLKHKNISGICSDYPDLFD